MCKMIQFTEVFCFQVVTSIKFFNLGLDVRWFCGCRGNLQLDAGLGLPRWFFPGYTVQ